MEIGVGLFTRLIAIILFYENRNCDDIQEIRRNITTTPDQNMTITTNYDYMKTSL